MATKKAATKKVAKKTTDTKFTLVSRSTRNVIVYRSKATGRAVSEKWALKNLDKVDKEVVRIGTLSVALKPKKKTSRIVKRDTKTGEFAKKTSRKRSVTADIIPTAAVVAAVKPAAKKKAAKKVAKKIAKPAALPTPKAGLCKAGPRLIKR